MGAKMFPKIQIRGLVGSGGNSMFLFLEAHEGLTTWLHQIRSGERHVTSRPLGQEGEGVPDSLSPISTCWPEVNPHRSGRVRLDCSSSSDPQNDDTLFLFLFFFVIVPPSSLLLRSSSDGR